MHLKDDVIFMDDRILREFLHEIKNPINALKLHLELCRRYFKEKKYEKVESKIGYLFKELDDLIFVVEEFSRFLHGSSLNKQKVDIEKLVLDIVNFVKPEAIINDIELSFSSFVSNKEVYVDPVLFKQVLLNLIINSIDALKEVKKADKKINITIKEKDNNILVEVLDNGTGIKKEIVAKIFNEFFTTKDYGTGLGLAIVKRIVEAHGGRIEVESEENSWTKFLLYLPVEYGEKDPNS